MKEYLDLLQKILDEGVTKSDRTGIGIKSIFGHQMRFKMSDGLPAVTTKKLLFKHVKSELLWFLEGSTDERRLAEIHYGKSREELVGKNTIWTANADKQGKDLGYTNTDLVKECGPIYGSRWRNTRGIDQIKNLVKGLKENPDSRRHIVSAWDVPNIEAMALPPCHSFFQCYVADNKLSLQLYQRSVDCPLGLPFNIVSYSILLHMLAQVTGYEPHEFIWTGGDCHIYLNQIDKVEMQLKREPYGLPKLWINPDVTDIFKFTMDDIKIKDYKSHPTILYPFAT